MDSEAPKGKNVRVVARLDKDKEITVAVLGASNTVASLDLYFNSSQQMAIALAKDTPKGTSVSLSGYFEPKSTDMDDDLFYGQEDEAEDDDELNDEDLEDSEEEKPSSKSKKEKLTLEQKLKNAKENSNKNATTTFGNLDDSEDSDEDDSDADDLEDLSDESEIEDDIADEDDESEDEDEAPAKPAGHSKKSAKVVADDDSEDDQSE